MVNTRHELLRGHMILKAGLALVGAVLGAYVGEEWVGGGALGAAATGAIVAALAAPLFRSLLALRRDQLTKQTDDSGKRDA